MFDLPPLISAIGLSALGFLALWPVSLARKDVSIVDFWWGPGFVVLLWTAALLSWPVSPAGWAVLGLVTVWGLRLGLVMGARRIREGAEDPRYVEMRRNRGPAFWWKSLFMVFCLQAVCQGIVALGAGLAVIGEGGAVGALSLLGGAIALIGLRLEVVADRELDAFRRRIPQGGLLTSGLRAFVRHPNYLGEILFWWGVALACLGAGTGLGLLSAAVMTGLLIRVSGVALLDERLARTRSAYGAYRSQTPALTPRLADLPVIAQTLSGSRGAALAAEAGDGAESGRRATPPRTP